MLKFLYFLLLINHCELYLENVKEFIEKLIISEQIQHLIIFINHFVTFSDEIFELLELPKIIISENKNKFNYLNLNYNESSHSTIWNLPQLVNDNFLVIFLGEQHLQFEVVFFGLFGNFRHHIILWISKNIVPTVSEIFEEFYNPSYLNVI